MQSTVPPVPDHVPVGFGFRPTDEELMDYYLKHKLLDDDPRVHVIPVINLCDVEPWDVPVMLAESVIRFNDPEWFFFSPLDYKYSNSKRLNRTTKHGFWKATGNDRNIKTRGTNNVIGTKKTLVFHEGRVPHGVCSNWVIHEYHAVTFHESQRTFVLCRLMKKPEKTTQGGTDALICGKGEPSRSTVSDYENQATAEGIPSGGTFTGIGTTFQEVQQTEKCFSPIQQSPTGIEQEEASFPNYPFLNAYFRNENNIMQTPLETTTEKFLMQTSFETTTEEDEFLNSILADENLVTDQASMHAFVNSSTQSESLRRPYCESSDTDAEFVSELDGNIVDISTMYNEYPNSDEYHSSKRFKSSHDAVHAGACLLSSSNEPNQEKQESIFQDDFWGVETSSCDLNTDKPLEFNCIDISCSPSTPRRWENQYHPRPNNYI